MRGSSTTCRCWADDRKKKIEPKTTAKKSDKAQAKADKKVERKSQGARWSDAGIKHNVTLLG